MKYRVVQTSEKSWNIEKKLLWFWYAFCDYSTEEYAIKRCDELEDLYNFRKIVVYPEELKRTEDEVTK